jgi:hypothetical protein
MNDEVELQPDVSEVLQEEAPDDYQAVKVCVEDIKAPVRVQELPRKMATTMSRSLGTTAFRVLRADHYRASATITSFDQDIYLAFNEASAQDTSTMARWPVDHPYTHTAATDVWVKTVADTSEVSIITERWATGD